jgi:putative transposase
MHGVKLIVGIRFKLQNNIYKIAERLPNSTLEVIDEAFGDTKIFTNNEIIDYLSNGLLHFEVTGKNTIKSDANINISYTFDDIDNLAYRDEAIFRYEVIKPLINGYKTMAMVDARVAEVNDWKNNPNILNKSTFKKIYNVSRASLYRWIKSYNESNGDFRSLVPSYQTCGGKNKVRISPIVMDFINESIKTAYLQQTRITIKDLRSIVMDKIFDYNQYSNNKLTCPPLSTFARYINKIPEYELVAGRIGKRIAERLFNPVGDGVKVTYPMERVEIDHTPVDVLIVDEMGEVIGRPYFVMAIDKLTRYPLGFGIGMSNGVGWTEVMECIRHILTHKSFVKEAYPFILNDWNAFGLPKTIVIDNGLEFKNTAMIDACYQIGFELQFCPPKVPQWKGSIERFFGSANTGLFHTLPGTTRSNPQKLGDENPVELAKLNFSTFLALIYKWIIDVYSQDLNKGAGGIPHKLWQIATEEFPVCLPNSTSEIAVLMGKVEFRQISRRGIEFMNLHYNSDELYKFFLKFNKENNGSNQSFKIKYNPLNIEEIYVYDNIIDKRWIKALCTNQIYSKNLTEWEHKEIQKYARNTYGKINELELIKSKSQIRQMIENGLNYTKAQIARAKKINSQQEIESKRKLNSCENKNVYIKQNTSSSGLLNIDNLGQKLPEETNTIIPEVFESISNINSDKIVSINNKNKCKSIKKEQKKNNNDFVDDLDLLDYSEFEISNNYLKD